MPPSRPSAGVQRRVDDWTQFGVDLGVARARRSSGDPVDRCGVCRKVANRHEDVGIGRELETQTRRRDPDDRKRPIVDRQGLLQNVLASLKVPLPELEAHDGDVVRSCLLVVAPERASGCRRDLEDIEEICGDLRDRSAFGAGRAGDDAALVPPERGDSRQQS